MFAFMGLGAVFGGLYVASRETTPPRSVLIACLALAASVGAAALSPAVWLAYLSLVAVGATSTAFLTMSNSVLQLQSEPQMRGRVLGLRATAVLGARPIGAPIVGWIGDHWGPRYSLAVGAAACLLIVVWAWPRLATRR